MTLLNGGGVGVGEELEQHIEDCSRCQARLDELTDGSADDSLTTGQKDLWEKAFAMPGVADSTAPMDRDTHVQGAQRSIEMELPDIPGYRFLDPIASGGMGAIYRAYQTRLSRDVAIKLMRPTHDRRMVARFEREMSAVGRLSHPNIVQAFDAGEADGIPYLVMELLDGEDLGQVMKQQSASADRPSADKEGMLSVATICRYIRDGAVALQTAHDQGLVHRDVKPSNLMRTSDGSIKLLDLGLASMQAEQANDGAITDAITIMGSLDYMAPEQGRETQAADARSDIYSLGCTLFALLTGKPPFSGDQFRTASQKLLAHACEARPDARSLNANVPAKISRLVQRMMSIDPANRPQSADQVADELTALTSESMEPPKSRFTAATIAGFGVPLIFLSIIVITLSDGSTIKVETEKPVVGVAIQDSGELPTQRKHSNTEPEESPSTAKWPEGAPEPANLPFDPAKALKHQKQWADQVGMPVAQKNSLGMTMRLIPPGEFQMGMTREQLKAILDNWESTNRKPKNEWFGQMAKRHLVRLTNPMLVSQHNVTVEGYKQLMVYAPVSRGRAPGNDGQSSSRTQLPVRVGWMEAVRFCNQLSVSESLSEYYSISDQGNVDLNDGDGYRLLTEAEWEFACRSGSDEMFWNDGAHLELEHYASFAKAADYRDFRQPPVGTKAANGFGLQDMFSDRNWCYDWWDIAWYERSSVNDPFGPETGQFETHVIRGPGRNTPEFLIGSAIRSHGGSDKESERCAIRICRTIAPP